MGYPFHSAQEFGEGFSDRLKSLRLENLYWEAQTAIRCHTLQVKDRRFHGLLVLSAVEQRQAENAMQEPWFCQIFLRLPKYPFNDH
jgi:hypothetical protein